MEESFIYNEDDLKKKSSAEHWQFGASSSISKESELSKAANQQKFYHLHLLQKKETTSERPIIQSSKFERLSYYRSFVSSRAKVQTVCLQNVQFNRFFWYYIFNVIFKSLTHTFVHIFLASYAPEEHFFLDKMFPIVYGFKFAVILATFVELYLYVDTIKLMPYFYIIAGLFKRNPWNRCETKTYVSMWNFTINCYELEEFSKKFENGTVEFHRFSYTTKDGETFQVAQVEYYRRIIIEGKDARITISFCVLWIMCALCHTQVFKKCFWKNADMAMLAESISSPPVVHVLTARSTQEIKPNWDSAVMITSNALCYIFKGLLAYKLSKYCETLGKTRILFTILNQESWYYLWPIYFTTFHLGDLFTIIFFTVNFLMEYLTVLVTYQCLVEVIVCEWRWVNRWLVVTIICIVGLIIEYVRNDLEIIEIVHFFGKPTTIMIEILVIYVFYPIGRFIDDITFHCGVPPTKLRILSFKIIPVYYTYKAYALLKGVYMAYNQMNIGLLIPYYECLMFLVFIPMVLGVLYAIYKYIFKLKKNWRLLFLPDTQWGPKDYATRQLRKQYDSRTAPRALSQYLLEKAESKAYHLDLRYDFTRRSTNPTAVIRVENEKKYL